MQATIFCMIRQDYFQNLPKLKIRQLYNKLQGTGKQLDSRSPGKEIYELIFEDVKPEYWKKYVEHQGKIMDLCV